MIQQTIVIDLDDTLCFPLKNFTDSDTKYGGALPNVKCIQCLQNLKNKGFHIIIHTARRMLTHEGDVDKIIEDVYNITTEWLEFYEVPYDELVFGKPYSSTYYVDDKAMNIENFIKWSDSIK